MKHQQFTDELVLKVMGYLYFVCRGRKANNETGPFHLNLLNYSEEMRLPDLRMVLDILNSEKVINIIEAKPPGENLPGREDVKLEVFEDKLDAYAQKIEPLALGIQAEAVNPIQQQYKPSTPFPTGLRWEDITIYFKNGHDVVIEAPNIKYKANYKELGFQDTKKLIPNFQWHLLERLSTHKGEVSWYDKDLPQNEKDQLKTRKYLLSKQLKEFFGINSSPFHYFAQERIYKIKINLVPERGSQRRIAKEEDPLGIQESIQDTMYQVYDGE